MYRDHSERNRFKPLVWFGDFYYISAHLKNMDEHSLIVKNYRADKTLRKRRSASWNICVQRTNRYFSRYAFLVRRKTEWVWPSDASKRRRAKQSSSNHLATNGHFRCLCLSFYWKYFFSFLLICFWSHFSTRRIVRTELRHTGRQVRSQEFSEGWAATLLRPLVSAIAFHFFSKFSSESCHRFRRVLFLRLPGSFDLQKWLESR